MIRQWFRPPVFSLFTGFYRNVIRYVLRAFLIPRARASVESDLLSAPSMPEKFPGARKFIASFAFNVNNVTNQQYSY